jgi:hypothetical protein
LCTTTPGLQGKFQVKTLHYQTPCIGYTLGIIWVKLKRGLKNNSQNIKDLEKQTTKTN